jgi:hypothetical protein
MINLFKGLTREYYLRQLFFGFLMFGFYMFMSTQGDIQKIHYGKVAFMLFSTFIYPYSRFAYEQAIDFVMGDTVLFSNIILFMGIKIFTMFICWAFAIFIAPVGLLFIYLHQRKA